MTFYSKPTLKRNHIADASAAEIQTKLEEYASDGWTLTSTDAASFGAAMYIYLYFAKE